HQQNLHSLPTRRSSDLQVYPNVLHLERKIDVVDLQAKKSVRIQKESQKSKLALFQQFYEEMTTSEFTEEKRQMMAHVIDRVNEEDRKSTRLNSSHVSIS